MATAVTLVNRLTPGTEQGRALVHGDSAEDRRARVVRALRETGDGVAARLSREEVDGLHAVAERLRPIFVAADAGDVDGVATLLNAMLADYRSAPRLSRHDQQPWHLHFHSGSAGLAAGRGAGCATALAVVMDGGGIGRLGVCDASNCDRVFVDTSRNGSRRFCSAACLNRAKVSAFRSRRTPAPG